MAEQAKIEVQDVNHKTSDRKDGKGTYTTIEIVGTDGSKFSNFDNKVNYVPKTSETVDITYIPVKTAKGGLVNNILLVTPVSGTSTVSKPTESKSTQTRKAVQAKPESTPFQSKAEETNSGPVHNTPVSTSTSMEVSGLLQALLHSGLFNNSSPDVLESTLRAVINIKRKVAQDLENNGKA